MKVFFLSILNFITIIILNNLFLKKQKLHNQLIKLLEKKIHKIRNRNIK